MNRAIRTGPAGQHYEIDSENFCTSCRILAEYCIDCDTLYCKSCKMQCNCKQDIPSDSTSRSSGESHGSNRK